MPNTVTILVWFATRLERFSGDRPHYRGGLLSWWWGPIDALDGAKAPAGEDAQQFCRVRRFGHRSLFELVILLGLMVYYVRAENWLACILVYLSAMGSVLVSYIRARHNPPGWTPRLGYLPASSASSY
jgi:hypothetical protein